MKGVFLCLLMVFSSTNNLGLKRAQFNISFSNIRGLHCNINKVHQLLLSEKPDVYSSVRPRSSILQTALTLIVLGILWQLFFKRRAVFVALLKIV